MQPGSCLPAGLEGRWLLNTYFCSMGHAQPVDICSMGDSGSVTRSGGCFEVSSLFQPLKAPRYTAASLHWQIWARCLVRVCTSWLSAQCLTTCVLVARRIYTSPLIRAQPPLTPLQPAHHPFSLTQTPRTCAHKLPVEALPGISHPAPVARWLLGAQTNCNARHKPVLIPPPVDTH